MTKNVTSKELSMTYPIRSIFPCFALKYVYDHIEVTSYSYVTSNTANTTFNSVNIAQSCNYYTASCTASQSSDATMMTRDNNYYAMRYYSTDLGRWISRDPIGIKGGLNVYGFVHNNGIGKIDVIGLQSKTPPLIPPTPPKDDPWPLPPYIPPEPSPAPGEDWPWGPAPLPIINIDRPKECLFCEMLAPKLFVRIQESCFRSYLDPSRERLVGIRAEYICVSINTTIDENYTKNISPGFVRRAKGKYPYECRTIVEKWTYKYWL